MHPPGGQTWGKTVGKLLFEFWDSYVFGQNQNKWQTFSFVQAFLHIFAIFADPRQTEGTCWRTNNPHYDQARVPCVSFRSFCPTYANIVAVDPGSALCASWVSFVSEFKLSTYLLFPPACAVRKRRLSRFPFCAAAAGAIVSRSLRDTQLASAASRPRGKAGNEPGTVVHAGPR